MARPGLYDELSKRGLLDQGRVIALGDGSDTEKAAHLDLLLGKAGSDFNVTPRAVFILRHRLQSEPSNGEKTNVKESSGAAISSPGAKSQNTDGGNRPKRKPPPGPHSTGFKPGNPGGPGGPPGNDKATKTGAHRNPLLHAVSPERAALVELSPDASAADILRFNIQVYMLALADMTREIEAINASTKRWWWLGSTYTRQEGDGELMGTGRISERKRVPREEALKTMIEARARVQRNLDNALTKLHKMETEGKGKKGLAEALAELFPTPEVVVQ